MEQVDAQVACGTRQQDIAQRERRALEEGIQGTACQYLVNGGVVEVLDLRLQRAFVGG